MNDSSPDRLDRALEALFPSAAHGRQFLRCPSPAEGGPDPVAGTVKERLARLETQLLDYVIQMAGELEDFGDVERERLSSEARATLIAVREIRYHFAGLD